MFLFFFFFKQKTAYEMRISDWSSDVCSSDLRSPRILPTATHGISEPIHQIGIGRGCLLFGRSAARIAGRTGRFRADQFGSDATVRRSRSEEHTSELQSLMRISYAVFCLKKKIAD